MSVQLITLSKETNDLVTDTLNVVTEAVTSTLGPNGKLAVVSVGTSAKVTKDGVTVAKGIKFGDPRQELINRIITEPAVKTDVECGDGTTTTIFLTHQLYRVLKLFPTFKNQKFIEDTVNKVVVELEANSIKVTPDSQLLEQLALTSSNNDTKLSKLVTDIYRNSLGKFPEIEIKEGINSEDRISRSSGLPLKLNFSNPSFSKSGNGDDTTYVKPIVILIDNNVKFYDKDALLEALSTFKDDLVNTYVLIARSFDNDINVILAQVNQVEKRKKFIPVQTNMGGSVGTLLMQDLATIFNTPLLGTFEEVAVSEFNPIDDTVIVGNTRGLLDSVSEDTTTRIQERVKLIENELNDYEGGERFSYRARFNESRVRNLNGELVTVFVGGQTISDVKERVDRFEDVIKAVKSALVNGVLPGMGTALINAGNTVIEKERIGWLTDEGITSENYSTEEKILTELGAGFGSQYLRLINSSKISMNDLIKESKERYTEELLCVNITTDEIGTAAELGIYDTAYASITALKGGFKTAKILANLNTVLLGDKLGSVKVN